MATSLRVTTLARRIRTARPDDRARRGSCERELVRIYQSDGYDRDDVVEVFVPFAMSFALNLKRGEEPLDDLRQVAMVGLIKALDRFDAQVGDSFVAYAAPTILGELRRHYRDTGWAVHVPRSKQELAQRIAKTEREINREGAVPTAQSIATRMGVPLEVIVEGRLASSAMRAGSIDRPIRSEDAEGATIAELHGDNDPGYERAENRATIAEATKDLPERDKLILTLRFRDGLSQRQIGEHIGVSQMQVSRLLRRTLEGLGAAAA